MLRGIIGATGGGKTMTLVGKLVYTLLNTDRFCATTLQELELPRLNEYLQEEVERLRKKYPARNQPAVDLDKRLLVIPKQDTRCFYRYRRGGLVLPEFEECNRDGKKKPLEQFNAEIEPYFAQVYARPETSGGVEYFLTECHRFFPAREYQTFARTMNFYATQNRHFDDNTWLETQFPGQIDLNFRELVVEWYYVRNHYREVSGMFRRKGEFSWRMYYELPKGKAQHADKGTMKLDAKGLASCYKTRGAVSALAGSEAEFQARTRKLPFWVLPALVLAAIVGLGLLVMATPALAEKGIGAVMGGVSKGVSKGMGLEQADPSPAPAVPAPAPVYVNPAPANDVHPATKEEQAPPRVYVTRIARSGLRITVTLSDGRVFTEADLGRDSGARVDRAGVTIDGVRYPMTRPRTPPRVYTTPAGSGGPVVQWQGPTPDELHEVIDAGGSWRTDPDGVQRLRRPEALGAPVNF